MSGSAPSSVLAHCQIADALRAVLDGLVHCEPLRARVLARNDDVDVVAAPYAVVEAAQQAVGVRRQIEPHDVRLLVRHVVEEAGILVRKAVVVLLPRRCWRERS